MAKKVYGMYFSGTGTTKKMVTYIASELASKIGGEYVEFDFTLPGVRKEVKEYEKDDCNGPASGHDDESPWQRPRDCG